MVPGFATVPAHHRAAVALPQVAPPPPGVTPPIGNQAPIRGNAIAQVPLVQAQLIPQVPPPYLPNANFQNLANAPLLQRATVNRASSHG